MKTKKHPLLNKYIKVIAALLIAFTTITYANTSEIKAAKAVCKNSYDLTIHRTIGDGAIHRVIKNVCQGKSVNESNTILPEADNDNVLTFVKYVYFDDNDFKDPSKMHDFTADTPTYRGMEIYGVWTGYTKYTYTKPFHFGYKETVQSGYYVSDGKDLDSVVTGAYTDGTTPEITAVAKPGYHFVKWSDGNTNPTRKDPYIENEHGLKYDQFVGFMFTAEFAPDTYKVNFYQDETKATKLYQHDVKYRYSVDVADAPASESHDFINWYFYDENGDKQVFIPGTTRVTEDLDVYANYTIKKFNVNFYQDETKQSQLAGYIDVEYNSTLDVKDAEIEHYNFKGWYYYNDKNEKTAFKANKTNIKASLDVYANLEAVKYPVTFYMDEEDSKSVIKKFDVAYNTSVQIENPKKNHYSFVKWYYRDAAGNQVDFVANETKIEGKLDVFAEFTPEKYAVNFYQSEAKEVALASFPEVEYNKTIDVEDPTIDHYTFKGWYYYDGKNHKKAFKSGETKISSNMDVYADFEIDTFPVTFYENEEDIESVILETNVPYNSSVDIENPVKEHHNFAGWYTRDAEGNKVPFIPNETKVENKLEVYAEFTPELYTVNFYQDADLDVLLGSVDAVEYQKSVTVDNPTMENYTFDGWFYRDSKGKEHAFVSGKTLIESNMNVYAKWNAIVVPTPDPVDPVEPTEPVVPTPDPVDPTEPTVPVTPVTPVTPVAPVSPVAPVNATPVTPVVTPTPLTPVIDNTDTVVIPDEETPQTKGDKTETIKDEKTPKSKLNVESDNTFNYTLLGSLLAGLFLLLLLLFTRRVKPMIQSITDNGDGTYTTIWAYRGRRFRKSNFDREDSVLEVLTGNDVKLPEVEEIPYEFERALNENVFVTVSDADTEIVWTIKKKKAVLNKEVITEFLNKQ